MSRETFLKKLKLHVERDVLKKLKLQTETISKKTNDQNTKTT